MSNIEQRIATLEKLHDDLVYKETRYIPKEGFLKILRYHIDLLKEVDNLVKSIKIGDAEGVEKFYQNRVHNN